MDYLCDMEGFSRINCSGVVFSRVEREDVRGPVHVKDHTLLYIRSGRAEVVFEGRRTPRSAGDCVFLRKDHRVVVEAWAPEDGPIYISLKVTVKGTAITAVDVVE